MAFTPKAWEDTPSIATPITAAALVDLEARVAARAHLISGEPFNVKDYGAVGDFTTDDTAAFQACFDAAASDWRGAFVVIPAPDVAYRLTSTVDIHPAAGDDWFALDIVGPHKYDVLQWDGGNSAAMFNVQGLKSSNIYGVSVRPVDGTTGFVAWDLDGDSVVAVTPRAPSSIQPKEPAPGS